jgi:hypothetical protein
MLSCQGAQPVAVRRRDPALARPILRRTRRAVKAEATSPPPRPRSRPIELHVDRADDYRNVKPT